jgi:hypothetical protein
VLSLPEEGFSIRQMQALVPMSTNGDVKGAHQPSPKGRADSKLVAIPNIPLGRKLEAPVSVQPSSALAEHPTPTPPVVSSSTSSKTSGMSEQLQWEYDVYAKPFVPSQLQAINLEKAGSIIPTRSRHRIDYPAYTATFAGTSFLPERPTQAPDVESESTSSLDLTARSYLHDITALWELECAAKVQQIGENAMYKVHLVSIQRSNREPLWILSVPGLRDDDPYLEKGDVLQLRQLWVDSAQNVFQVPMSMEDPHNGQIRWGYKSWTGVQHDAYIAGVNRKKETVYLEAEGLAPLHANGISFPMMVNVIVPMKHASLEAQRMALVKVSIELAKVLSLLISSGDTLTPTRHYLLSQKQTPTISMSLIPLSSLSTRATIHPRNLAMTGYIEYCFLIKNTGCSKHSFGKCHTAICSILLSITNRRMPSTPSASTTTVRYRI